MLIATSDVYLAHFQRAVFYRNIQGDKYREFEKERVMLIQQMYISNRRDSLFVLRLLLCKTRMDKYINHRMGSDG